MAVTQNSDAAALVDDTCEVRLRVEVYDALAKARGIGTTVEAQAAYHHVHRSTLFKLRGGKGSPRLVVAMRIAADLGTTVDALFERRAS